MDYIVEIVLIVIITIFALISRFGKNENVFYPK